MTADPIMSRIFTYFDQQHSAKPPGETGRVGVSWVSRQEESKELSEGKTHEYILEHLRTNPSVLAMIDFYSDENLAARVTSVQNMHEAAGIILSKLNVPLDGDIGYFNQLMALVYGMHFNRLEADEQEAEVKKYGLVSDLIMKLSDILKLEDPHQKYEKLNLLLPELKGLLDIEVERLELEIKFNGWNLQLTGEKHAGELHTVEDFQLLYDFFYEYKFNLGLVAVVFVTNLYLFRSEKFDFKTVKAMTLWTVYSSGLAWIGLNLLGMVIKKMVRITTPVFRYYIPASKPSLHPLSKPMNQFIEGELPKCYKAQLPQLITKWQITVLDKYFRSKQTSR